MAGCTTKGSCYMFEILNVQVAGVFTLAKTKVLISYLVPLNVVTISCLSHNFPEVSYWRLITEYTFLFSSPEPKAHKVSL